MRPLAKQGPALTAALRDQSVPLFMLRSSVGANSGQEAIQVWLTGRPAGVCALRAGAFLGRLRWRGGSSGIKPGDPGDTAPSNPEHVASSSSPPAMHDLSMLR